MCAATAPQVLWMMGKRSTWFFDHVFTANKILFNVVDADEFCVLATGSQSHTKRRRRWGKEEIKKKQWMRAKNKFYQQYLLVEIDRSKHRALAAGNDDVAAAKTEFPMRRFCRSIIFGCYRFYRLHSICSLCFLLPCFASFPIGYHRPASSSAVTFIIAINSECNTHTLSRARARVIVVGVHFLS